MTLFKLSKLSNLAWLGLLAAMAGSANNACSNSPGPPAKAYVNAQLGPGVLSGVNDSSACNMQGDLYWQIGEGLASKPTEFEDGSHQAGGAVSIFCSVDSSSNGFNINLSATLQGMMSGSLNVSGFVNQNGSTSGLHGVFATMGQQFIDNNCTFTQTYNMNPVPGGGGPASGRIWGHIDCPNGVENGMFGTGGDGGSVLRTCEGSADFLFENCN
jgi:hypothetical protein